MGTFAPDGYLREPIGPTTPTGAAAELRSFFGACFSVGGGIGLQLCAVTDDGVRCALEYNYVRWGDHDLAPQAGIAIYERGTNGLLAAARLYDDLEPPIDLPYSPSRRARHVCGAAPMRQTRWRHGSIGS